MTKIGTQMAAQVQTLLEGVPLPARNPALLAYARGQDEAVARTLERLPEREYRSLDQVGEALVSVQPAWRKPQPPVPRAESGEPPGGEAYVSRA